MSEGPFILIGGPSAGLRLQVREGEKWLFIPRRIPMSVATYPVSGHLDHVVTDKYTLRIFSTKDSRTYFYGWSELSDEQCFTELLSNYVPFVQVYYGNGDQS